MRFAIASCGWLADRYISCRRLEEQLGGGGDVKVFKSVDREHAAVWSLRIWEWACEVGGHVCVLNDDVILHPQFRAIVEAMVTAVPDEVISLHTNIPGAVEAAKSGFHWCRSYWVTGPGYILPPLAARAMLSWGPWNLISQINEDQRMIHACWESQSPAWCAIPAPLTHDATVPSTLGYDQHPNRTPTVPWGDFPDAKLTSVDYWRPDPDTPLVPNPWMPVEKLDYMRRVLKSGSPICAMCLTLEGVVSTRRDGPTVCLRCLEACHGAVEKRRAGNG
jgi:hypothetical protein